MSKCISWCSNSLLALSIHSILCQSFAIPIFTTMASPTTYHAYRRTTGPLPQTIEKVTETIPSALAADEVLIRIRAVSLNFRDIAMLDDRYPLPYIDRGIPACDCAAEVVETGSGVKDFKAGDRVISVIDLNNITDEDENPPLALGGEVDGVLREYASFKERHLLPISEHLSWEEASIIPCAGSTAWTALHMPSSIGKIKSALLQGTGGVSTIALLLRLAASPPIRPIITSSSDAKLSSLLAKLSSLKTPNTQTVGTINYRTAPAWEAEAKRLTAGRGVDVVLNNAGPASLPQDVEALASRGTVALVGLMEGFAGGGLGPATVVGLMVKRAGVRGIAGAPKSDIARLNAFLAEKKVSLEAAIDRVFGFEEAVEAFEYLKAGKHVGKVVIRI